MQLNNQLPLQRLIGKIDNDFNIDNSDWIPRVGAWVTDALSQMKLLPMEYVTEDIEVNDRIADLPCMINTKGIEVFDKNGCPINNANEIKKCSCGGNSGSSSTGGYIGVDVNDYHNYNNHTTIVKVVNPNNRNFVISNDKQIELNFDTDSITIKLLKPATYFDEYFNCEVPYIYDNGVLLEALAWYCLFKMLSRGYKHQVYSLASAQQYLNPFMQWNFLKGKAQKSVLSDMINLKKDSGWNNFFFNSTFRPRD